MAIMNTPLVTSLEALLKLDLWDSIPLNAGWTTVVTGSGLVNQFPDHLVCFTGTTALSTARARTTDLPMYRIGESFGAVDWRNRNVLLFTLVAVGTSTGFSRLSFGKTASDGIGNMVRRGVGIRVDNLALMGQAHDGTTLSTVDLSVTLVTNVTIKVAIIATQGEVEWFVDDDGNGLISRGVSSGGPRGLDENFPIIQGEAENGADAALQDIRIATIKFLLDQ